MLHICKVSGRSKECIKLQFQRILHCHEPDHKNGMLQVSGRRCQRQPLAGIPTTSTSPPLLRPLDGQLDTECPTSPQAKQLPSGEWNGDCCSCCVCHRHIGWPRRCLDITELDSTCDPLLARNLKCQKLHYTLTHTHAQCTDTHAHITRTHTHTQTTNRAKP